MLDKVNSTMESQRGFLRANRQLGKLLIVKARLPTLVCELLKSTFIKNLEIKL